MFKFNAITRVFRQENDGDGNDLGINPNDANSFAGAGGEAEWEESGDLGMFTDDQDLSNLSDGALNQTDDDDDGDAGKDDDSEDKEADDSDDADDDDSDDDDDDNSDDEEDNSDDDNSDDEEDNSDDSDDSDDDDSEDKEDDSDDSDSDDSDDEDTINGEAALVEFTDMAATSDALADALTNAANAEQDPAAFKAANKGLYDTFKKANVAYQEAVLAEDAELMADAQSEMLDAQMAITSKQSQDTAAQGNSISTARAAVQGALDKAIGKAAQVYPELDSKSKSSNKVLIRLVNDSFKGKVSSGTSHVKAFVEAVEEVAMTSKLLPVGEATEAQRDKTVDKKTKGAVKKRIAAAKKTPKRKASKNTKGTKISAAALAKKSGDAFFKDSFVKDLGIKSEEY